jgi:hypothetical protein
LCRQQKDKPKRLAESIFLFSQKFVLDTVCTDVLKSYCHLAQEEVISLSWDKGECRALTNWEVSDFSNEAFCAVEAGC